MDQFMGINMRREDPIDRMKATGFAREYHDWHINEGFPNISYDGGISFDDHSPGYPNSKYKWNTSYHGITAERFDSFYEKIQAAGVDVAPTILGNTIQLVRPGTTTTLADQYLILEEKPAAPGADFTDAASYIAHAEYLYHLAARYGKTSFSSNRVNTVIAPKAHASESPLTGLGTVNYLENWNEHDKDWFINSYPNTYFAPEEYAAMTSADYDGHNQTLGLIPDPDNAGQMLSTVGMKNADPTINAVMSGLAFANLAYIRDMVDWFKANRPANAAFGQIPMDVINIHNYAGNADHFYGYTSGVSPEEFGLKPFLKEFDTYRDSLELAFNQDFELWLSEFGYDTNDLSPTRAPAIGTTDNYEVQAQWIIRSFMEAAAAGIDRALVYDLRDNCSQPDCGLFQSSGLLEAKANNYKPKNSWYYTYAMKNVLNGMVFVADQSPCADLTCARIYKFQDPNNSNKRVYVAWSPTSNNTSFSQQIDLEGATAAKLVQLDLPSIYGTVSPLTGATPSVTISERPVFIMVDGADYYSAAACTSNFNVTQQSCSTVRLNWDAPGAVTNFQLWVQPGTISNANFSHRLATLVTDTLSANLLSYTVTGLEESSDYTFFLFPEGVGKSETAKFCSVQTSTTTTANSCQINMDPTWIFDYVRLASNADNLLDEQTDSDPFCGTANNTRVVCDYDVRTLSPTEGLQSYYFNSWLFEPNLRKAHALGVFKENLVDNPLCDPRFGTRATSNWGVDYQNPNKEQVSIDLQQDYYLEAISLFDAQGIGEVEIQYADSPNGPWTSVLTYRTVDYLNWKTFANIFPINTPIRYLRIWASEDDAANIGELSICGLLTGMDRDIDPGVVKNAKLVSSTCEVVNLEWAHPFDADISHYKVIVGGVVSNIPFMVNEQLASITGLMADTNYEFAIVTIDNAGNASDTIKVIGQTFAEGECDLTCNLSCACQICLRPSWITELSTNVLMPPTMLIDEQNTLPICGIGSAPITNRGADFSSGSNPLSIVQLDLQEWHLLHTLHLYDGSSSGLFKVEYLDEMDVWQELFSYQTAKYNEWVSFSNLEITTKLLRLTQMDNGGVINEIGICGDLINPIEDCPANLTIDSMLTTTAIYKAENIFSSSILQTGIDIKYEGANSITLQPGFFASAGTTFLASIEDCIPSVFQETKEAMERSRVVLREDNLTMKEASNLVVYPNPFKEVLNMEYELLDNQRIDISLMDYLGRRVQNVISDEIQVKGFYQSSIIVNNLQAGTYFLVFRSGGEVQVKKVVMME